MNILEGPHAWLRISSQLSTLPLYGRNRIHVRSWNSCIARKIFTTSSFAVKWNPRCRHVLVIISHGTRAMSQSTEQSPTKCIINVIIARHGWTQCMTNGFAYRRRIYHEHQTPATDTPIIEHKIHCSERCAPQAPFSRSCFTNRQLVISKLNCPRTESEYLITAYVFVLRLAVERPRNGTRAHLPIFQSPILLQN